MGNALVFTDENFEKEVISSEIPVLVDFWAEWCGPCKMIGPAVEEVASEYADKLKVGKVNVDACKEISSDYGIMSIPTLIVFKGGKVADKLMGAVSKPKLKSFIDKNI